MAAIVLVDAERTSPGPLSPPHASLEGGSSCEECHFPGADHVAEACNACHTPVARQLADLRGLHGGLDPEQVADCGTCHPEHHGDALPVVSAQAFDRAGIPERDAFDHAGLAFDLVGRHTALACDACHEHADVPFLSEGQQRFLGLQLACESCHENPHGPEEAQRCDTCHGQQSPFPEAPGFEHTVEFPLRDAHAGLACADCHDGQAGTSWFEPVAGRGPTPVRDCATCHQTPHSGRLAAFTEDCATCHAPTAGGFRRAHDAPVEALHASLAFPLDQGHGGLDCSACHELDLPLAERALLDRRSDCRSCHGDPHGEQFRDARGVLRSCADCHGTDHYQPSRFDLAAHADTALPLLGAHARADCAACHVPNEDESPVAYAGLGASCTDCHENVHRPAFLDSTGELQDCATCHDPEAYSPTLAGTFDHGRDAGMFLTGAHERAACEVCHAPGPGGAQLQRTLGLVADAFPPLGSGVAADRCERCHADVHVPSFAPRGCDACHGTEDFHQLLPDGFDHGADCGLALTGAHARADCNACHAAPLDGRTLGSVGPAFPGDVQRCDTCHVDPHAGAFRTQPGEGTDCARCHGTEAFAPALTAFDHGRDAGFALDGAHGRADCAACHGPLATPDLLGRTFAQARGTTCTDCHEDPHLGQFAREGRVDCLRCHGTDAFRVTAFDHQNDTRFPLDATHRDVACAACHVPWPVGDGREVVRYRPLGVACGDCHRGDPAERAPR